MTDLEQRTVPVEPTTARRDRTLAALRAVGTAAVPVAIALVVAGVVLAATGRNPFDIYARLIVEAFGSLSRIDATLAAATPLLFTALAAAFAYRAGVFTVGVEGSFVMGGLSAAVVGAQMEGVPAPLSILIPLTAGIVAGGAVAVVPALLRASWGVDEVVTTLMLNFVVTGVAGWLVQSFFQERGQANSATAYVATDAELPPLWGGAQTTVGLLIALALAVGYAVFMRRTSIGLEFRAVGLSPRFSIAQGLRVRTVLLCALIGAGLIGGLGGAVHALGAVHRYSGGFSASVGFTGIAIALIARFHPAGIIVGAVLFGALNAAGATIQLFVNIPVQLIDIVQGTVMVFAVVHVTWSLRGRRSSKDREVRA